MELTSVAIVVLYCYNSCSIWLYMTKWLHASAPSVCTISKIGQLSLQCYIFYLASSKHKTQQNGKQCCTKVKKINWQTHVLFSSTGLQSHMSITNKHSICTSLTVVQIHCCFQSWQTAQIPTDVTSTQSIN